MLMPYTMPLLRLTRELQANSFKFHIVSVRDTFAQVIIRRTHWVDTGVVLADGLTKGGIDRALFRNASNGCICNLAREALSHCKRHVGSTTKQPEVAAAEPQ